MVEALMIGTVEAWDPKWAVVTTVAWSDLYPATPYPAWVTFLPIPPDDAAKGLFGRTAVGDGTVFVLTRSAPSPRDSSALRAADRLAIAAARGGCRLADRQTFVL